MFYICIFVEVNLYTLKKILSISLLLTYLTFSTGINLSKHYCGGKLISVKLSSQQEKACDKCGGKPMKGCCKDIQSSFKIDNDQQQTAKLALDYPTPFPVYYQAFATFKVSDCWNSLVVTHYNKTPDIPKWNNEQITFFCTYII